MNNLIPEIGVIPSCSWRRYTASEAPPLNQSLQPFDKLKVVVFGEKREVIELAKGGDGKTSAPSRRTPKKIYRLTAVLSLQNPLQPKLPWFSALTGSFKESTKNQQGDYEVENP